MHQIRPQRPMARGLRRPALSLALSLGLAALFGSAASADPLPLPSTDFALTASLKRGGTMELAHSQSKMRVVMNTPAAKTPIVGLIDLTARKMVMMMPNVANMAIEIDLPPQYSVAALSGNGTRVGQDEVAGEACDLWQVDTPPNAQSKLNARDTVACITQDGIALRTEAEIDGKKQVLYEVTSLTRGPQDPKLFQLPADVQVMKMPKGKLGGALNLPIPGAR